MTSISVQEFYAERGSIFTQTDAEKIGPALQELSEDGDLKEEVVVEVARSANSPLNAYFEWDDHKAAHRFRLGQARTMMQAIRVRYPDEHGKERAARAYQVTRPAQRRAVEPTRQFRTLSEGSAFAAQMIDAAREDLRAWEKKYAAYLSAWDGFAAAFREVANQISEFEEDARGLALAAGADDVATSLLEWRQAHADELAAWPGCAEQAKYLLEAIACVERVAQMRPGSVPTVVTSAPARVAPASDVPPTLSEQRAAQVHVGSLGQPLATIDLDASAINGPEGRWAVIREVVRTIGKMSDGRTYKSGDLKVAGGWRGAFDFGQCVVMWQPKLRRIGLEIVGSNDHGYRLQALSRESLAATA